jgi:hypothetical protein
LQNNQPQKTAIYTEESTQYLRAAQGKSPGIFEKNTRHLREGVPFSLPQVDDTNTPRPMDAVGELNVVGLEEMLDKVYGKAKSKS